MTSGPAGAAPRSASAGPAGAPRSRGPWATGLALFLLALVPRLAYLFALRGDPLFEHLLGDAPLWFARGAAVADGDLVGPRELWQAPGYGWFLGLLRVLFGADAFAARLAQAGLGALTAALVGELARRVFGRRTGLVAGVLAALYPPLWFFEAQLLRAAPAQLLVTLFLLAGVEAARRSGAGVREAEGQGRANASGMGPARPLALAGWALGCALTVREGLLVLLLPFCLLAFGARGRAGARPLLAALLGLALGLAPLVLRNLAAGVAPLARTTNLGPNLYIGNHEGADGLYRPLRPERGDPLREQADARDLASLAVGRRLSGAEASRWWTEQAWDWVRDHPGDALLLTLRRARLVLHAEEWADSESLLVHRDALLGFELLHRVWNYGLLVALALAGLALLAVDRAAGPGAGRRPGVRWLLGCALAILVSLLPLFVFARYRLPLLPCLLPLAAHALVEGARRVRAGRPGSLLPAGAVLLLTLALLHAPAGVHETPRATHWMNLGVAQLRAGEAQQALGSFERARRLAPDLVGLTWNAAEAHLALDHLEQAERLMLPVAEGGGPLASDAWVLVARARLGLGDPGRATLAYEAGVRAGASAPETAHALGKLARALGRPAQAQALLRAAVEGAPELAAAWSDLGLVLEEDGRWAAARDAYRAALDADPGLDAARFNLAWLLAVAPDPALRDGTAVRALLVPARERHGERDPECLALEAAAAATEGRVADAARLGREALDRARTAGDAGLAELLSPRVAAWERGFPWTYPSPPPR